jgi:hypothetical protein
MGQIFFWQAYYLGVVCVRGGQVLPWFNGFGRAILLLPRMLAKRQAINKARRVSLAYLEEIIVQSEGDLEAARIRRNKQVLAQAIEKDDLKDSSHFQSEKKDVMDSSGSQSETTSSRKR